MSEGTTFRQRIADELNRLAEISAELRQAMLERNPERIMAAVALGEQFEPSPALAAARRVVLADERVAEAAGRLRRLQESNRLLATSFVKLYRQILRPSGELAEKETGLYGRTGAVEPPRPGPMLIRQIG